MNFLGGRWPFRFAGQAPGRAGLLREPALWTGGLGTLAAINVFNDGASGHEVGVNALMTALPMLAAAGGAGVMAARSPRIGKYLDAKLSPYIEGRSIQSPARAAEAERSIQEQIRLQRFLSPGLSEAEIMDAINADTRERLSRALGLSAGAGAALGALGVVNEAR